MENYSLSDIAAASGNDAFGGNAWILILLFAMIFGGNGFGFGGNSNNAQEILAGQNFQNVGQAINKVGDGIASLGYDQLAQMNGIQTNIGSAITAEGRSLQSQIASCCCENQKNTDSLRYDMATQFAASNANTTAQIQKVLDSISANRISQLEAQVSELKTQNMFCGLPRINPYGYAISGTGCNCTSV